MSFLPDDVIDTAEIAGSNYINVGTLLPFFKDALPEIAYKLHKNGKTWVLDPVAAGIGKTRTAILESFRTYPPTIVRGNASEIIALDAMWGLAQHDSTVPGTRRQAWKPSTKSIPPLTRPNEWLVILRNTPLLEPARWPFPEQSIW